MSKTVIEVTNLSKQYRLGQVGATSIADDLNRFWHRIRGKEDPFLRIGDENDRTSKGNSDYVWALKEISFSVKQGEVLGIIGRNGAGKSTLLKILSRTTAPTTGEYKIKGRVASLLEVGTGFHPDLTGRENIFLNGAILGMTKSEIKRSFDEIVAFSGVERYIDTPVKRYSSGMYVRLAFAVAAHLDPEILIVDEVLAVGDAEFQKKCMGKIKDVSGQGRTTLFVSHNMKSIRDLCSRGIIIEKGQLKKEGPINEIVNFYMSRDFEQSEVIPEHASLYNSGQAKFRKIELLNPVGESVNEFFFRQKITIRLHLEVFEKINNALVSIVFNSPEGDALVFSTYREKIYKPMNFDSGMHVISVEYEVDLLPKKYFITLGFSSEEGAAIDYVENIFSFNIDSTGVEKGCDYPWGTVHGFIEPKTNWTFSKK